MSARATLAAVAVLALAAGCSPAAEPTTPPPATATQADPPASSPEASPEQQESESAAPSPSADEQDPPAGGELPFAEGEVDLAEFGKVYGAAMRSARSITLETRNSSGDGDSVVQIDQSAETPRLYAVTQAGPDRIETITIGDRAWSRFGDSPWEEDPDAVDSLTSAWERTSESFGSVTLVDKAERRFEVIALLGVEGPEGIPGELVLDEQFRASTLTLGSEGAQSVTTYSYDDDLDIPDPTAG